MGIQTRIPHTGNFNKNPPVSHINGTSITVPSLLLAQVAGISIAGDPHHLRLQFFFNRLQTQWNRKGKKRIDYLQNL
jgi:hypothetical protein